MKLLIWDFDGTLGYRQGGMWSASLLQVIQRSQPDSGITSQQISPYMQSGFPWHAPEILHPEVRTADQWWDALFPVFERALAGLGMPEDQVTRLARGVRDAYTDLSAWRAYDDAIPTLERLANQGWTHAMLSNHVPELARIVDHLGISTHLARLFNSADTGYEKPHPQAFQQVLGAFPEAKVCCMVGDSMTADVRGAEAAGIPAVLVRTANPEARWHCHDLGGLPGAMAEIAASY